MTHGVEHLGPHLLPGGESGGEASKLFLYQKQELLRQVYPLKKQIRYLKMPRFPF
jgi:hypothetical protein